MRLKLYRPVLLLPTIYPIVRVDSKTTDPSLQKDKLFCLGRTAENWFHNTETSFSYRTTLAYPDFSRLFGIHPDICDYGLGAVFLREKNKQIKTWKKPLAYASRLMSRSEANYSIMMLRITHRNGRLHSDADVLSRYPVEKAQYLEDDLRCLLS
jgi:hypothetical protein